MRSIALVILIGLTSSAQAGSQESLFAQYHDLAPDKVRDVVGFELPAGGGYTHVVAGRFEKGKYVMAGAVLLRCSRDWQCSGRRADFGSADEIELGPVVDLEGEPGTVTRGSRGSRGGGYQKLAGKRSAKFPVLVVRTMERREETGTTRAKKTVTGKRTEGRIWMISLAAKDRGNVVMQDTFESRGPTGAGMRRGYRLERPEDPKAKSKALELVASEQREIDNDSRCMRPKPTEQRFKLDGRHYKQGAHEPGFGCR